MLLPGSLASSQVKPIDLNFLAGVLQHTCSMPSPSRLSDLSSREPPATPHEGKPEHAKIIFGSNFASAAVSLAATPPQDFAQPFGGRDHGGSVQPAGLPRQSLDRTGDADGSNDLPRG